MIRTNKKKGAPRSPFLLHSAPNHAFARRYSLILRLAPLSDPGP
jgi:hypothetical protein